MTSVLTSAEDLTPKWLTAILRGNDLLQTGEVVNIKVLLTRQLHVSNVARLEVSYSPDVAPLGPSKLFLKLSKPDAVPSGNNKSEVEFYRTVGAEIEAPPLVKCYDASFDEDKGSSHILMEDLSETHFQSTPGEAPTEVYSKLAVECLAQFHAYWWDHPKVGAEVGRVFDKKWLKNFTGELDKSVQNFINFLGHSISAEQRDAYHRMIAASSTIWGRLTNRSGLTVTNGDLHWWNFLLPKDPEREQTRLIDWQLWHIDLGARDLAFLIALSGFAERRPELERALLHHYHDTLVAAGVQNYTRSEFWTDYRWSAIRNLNIPVIFWSQGKHETTWKSMLERAFEAYDDLGCTVLLA